MVLPSRYSVFFFIFTTGNVSAYAPSKLSGGKLASPTFLSLPRQELLFTQSSRKTLQSRHWPILFASEDPEMPLQETLESTSSVRSEYETASSTKTSASAPSRDNTLDFNLDGLGLKIALGVVAAVAAYAAASIAIASATEYLTYLQNNFWDILAGLPEAIWGVLVAIFGFLKVFLPAVGEIGKSAYEIASPIVTETSQRAIEAAAPVLQDTADRVADVAGPLLEEATKNANEAAAPYVNQLNSAVETSIVAPIQDATDAMGGAVDAQIQGATKAVETQLQGATKSMGDAIDFQFKKFFP